MEKKSDVSDAKLLYDAGLSFSGDMNFNSYRLDLSFRQLRIIQLSLLYYDSCNRGNLSQVYLDDLFYTLCQVDGLICEHSK